MLTLQCLCAACGPLGSADGDRMLGQPSAAPGPGAAGASGDGTAARISSVTAAKADDFLQSIGVCAHVGQGVDAPGPSALAMSYAGIRNLRDDGNPAHVGDWIAMHESAGVRLCLLTDRDVTSTVSMAKQLNSAGALMAVEGPNEPNNFPLVYQGQPADCDTSFLPVARMQRDLYAAVRAEATLAAVPVFHSSLAGGSEPDNVGLQFLTIPEGAGTAMPDGTQYADFANIHNYVRNRHSDVVDNMAWSASDPTLDGRWDGLYAEYGHTWHGGFAGYSEEELAELPRVTTETGWEMRTPAVITDEQQGRLFLNVYLSAFKQGFTYTFIYMLRDDVIQGLWGLFDTNYAPKSSAVYLHNLTTILADGGSMDQPSKLDYAIPARPATIHDLLREKSSGAFELIVWDERPMTGSDRITVDFAEPRAHIAIYDPTLGASPREALRNVGSVAVTLSDHPLVLEL